MIGYMDPTLGKKRRQALSQYLRQQSVQRSQAAGAMRSVGTSAFGGGYGSGTQFRRGGSRATPEKFAFAGTKPSLKTLLGLVGRNLGFGGTIPDFRVFGAAAPVTGLPYGGTLPVPETMQPSPGGPSGGGPSSPPVNTPFDPTPAPGAPPMNSTVGAGNNLSYGDLANSIQSSLPGLMTGGLGGLAGLLASIGGQSLTGYHGPRPTPILGSLKYDQLQ